MKLTKKIIKVSSERQDRIKLSNSIHDDLQQLLVATTFQLDEALLSLKNHELDKVQDAINRGKESLHEAIRATRSVSSALLFDKLSEDVE